MKGEKLGYVSLAFGVFFGILTLLTFLFPSPASFSYSAVVLGVGTVVATIYCAVALLS